MAQSLWQRTEAIQAAEGNRLDELKGLLESGGAAVEDACNDERQNLLHIAALNGAEDALSLLLRRPRLRKKVDKKDASNRTPLHLAAAMGYDGCVGRLIEVAASLDRQDATSSTPLLLAARFDWVNAVRLLLEAGADPLIEDEQGCNAVDVAKPGSEVADLMSAFRGMRRQSGWFPQLRRCLAPQLWRNKGTRQEAYIAGGDATPVTGHLAQGTSDDLGPVYGKAQGEAAFAAGYPQSAATESDLQKANEPSAALSAGASKEAKRLNADAAALSPSQDLVCTYRFHFFFNEEVKRLEFEVAWKEQVAVGTVKPGGEAERRGLLPGDALVEIGGVATAGNGRDQLLPLLKGRPLLLKVDREERLRNPQEPYIQLEVKLDAGGGSAGLTIRPLGQLHVVNSVAENSAALASGLLEGDAIVSVNGTDVTSASADALLAALEERPVTMTVCRRPSGQSLEEPWRLPTSKGPNTSRLL
eukprot:TRINITY_DN91301_c0_g1_i1.p1 TRINITY_DN91301_c0_g1~~TRINITY_DN91301_c0_g1_i1.p1  ORF type:complete len:473 (+),score=125.01 TRINITY_DN91301_c0_g1_i1:37-1455(+)